MVGKRERPGQNEVHAERGGVRGIRIWQNGNDVKKSCEEKETEGPSGRDRKYGPTSFVTSRFKDRTNGERRRHFQKRSKTYILLLTVGRGQKFMCNKRPSITDHGVRLISYLSMLLYLT